VLVSALLVASPALAEKKKGTETLEWDDYVAVKMELDGTQTISYDVTVTGGVNVNVWFLEQSQYDDYVQTGEFGYYVLFSTQDTRSASTDFAWTDSGNHYIVIDTINIAGLNETATVEYNVEWDSASLGDWLSWIGICVVLIVVGIVGMFFLRKVRKKGGAPPAQQPYQQQQYQQQPYEQDPNLQQVPGSVPPPQPSDMGPGYVPQETGYEQPPEVPASDPPRTPDPPQ